MKELGIFTPTYNRVGLLPRLYESLIEQTNKNFTWIVVDDGSIDGTNELILEYINEGYIDIVYLQKENGGVHTASNSMLEKLDSELVFFAPTDCILQPNAVETILSDWNTYKKKPLLGLMYHYTNMLTKERLGKEFPDSPKEVSFIDCLGKLNISSDKVIVIRSEYYKLFPYPQYDGEKLFPDSWKYYKLSSYGNFKLINKEIIEVEYTDDGYSKNLIRFMSSSPRGYKEYQELRLTMEVSKCQNIKSCIHIVGFSYLLRDYTISNPQEICLYKKVLYYLLFPLGLLWGGFLKNNQRLSYFILNKYRRGLVS